MRDAALEARPEDGSAYLWTSTYRQLASQVRTNPAALDDFEVPAALREFALANQQDMRASYLTEVYLDLNPKEVRFQPRDARVTEFKTETGNRFLYWTGGQGGRSEELFTLAGQGSTGALRVPNVGFNPGKGLVAGQGVLVSRALDVAKTNARNRLLNWLNLFMLSVEPKFIEAANLENLVSLTCSHQGFSSMLLRSGPTTNPGGSSVPVTFYGHFVRPLAFADSATSPFALDYQFEFLVHAFDAGGGVQGWDGLAAQLSAAWAIAEGT